MLMLYSLRHAAKRRALYAAAAAARDAFDAAMPAMLRLLIYARRLRIIYAALRCCRRDAFLLHFQPPA